MSYIEVIPESEATGELAELYEKYCDKNGRVENVLKIHSLHPKAMTSHMQLYLTAVHRSSPLTKQQREMIGITVSRLNGCSYCVSHHTRSLKRILREDEKETADFLAKGEPAQRLNKHDLTMLAYCEKLTREPSAMTAADVQQLRDTGFSDRAIHDIALVVGYFCFVNRMVLALGVEIENQFHD